MNPTRIRLMSERRLGFDGVAYCTGLVGKPTRRCEWRAIGWTLVIKRAMEIMESWPTHHGRAIVLLSHPNLLIVNRAGEVVQDNREELGR